jgi:polysaccharide export outer membrane protein
MTDVPRWRTCLAAAIAVPVLLALGASLARAQDKAYVIGPEDILEVQVWDNKDLNHAGFVRPDGKTSLPLVGEIQAAGKTVQQLQDDLTAIYAKTVKQPVVTVIVREIRSRPVHFVGGFGRPGIIQLTRDLTLMEAVALVGGLAATADSENSYIIRGNQRIPVDFERLVKKGDLSQNIKLLPGDSVVSPIADLIYVQGEVKSPGAFKYTSDMTIAKAITQAGGTTPLAAPGRVDLLRGEDEKRVRMRIDLDKIMRAPESNPDLKLRPNDIIFVPQRLF